MSGRVLEVFVLTEDGQSSNYDWKAREAQNASLKSRQHDQSANRSVWMWQLAHSFSFSEEAPIERVSLSVILSTHPAPARNRREAGAIIVRQSES